MPVGQYCFLGKTLILKYFFGSCMISFLASEVDRVCPSSSFPFSPLDFQSIPSPSPCPFCARGAPPPPPPKKVGAQLDNSFFGRGTAKKRTERARKRKRPIISFRRSNSVAAALSYFVERSTQLWICVNSKVIFWTKRLLCCDIPLQQRTLLFPHLW